MITLTLSKPYWLGDTEEEQQRDLCLHGHVLFKVDDTVIGDDYYCVSAAAMQLMRTVLCDHFRSEEYQMLPCCGHFMLAEGEDMQTVCISGCPNGTDFNVQHEGENILLWLADGSGCTVPFDEYRDAAIAFAAQVEQVYTASPQRSVPDEEPGKSGYIAFWREWAHLKEKIASATPDCAVKPTVNHNRYCNTSDEYIIDISADGIHFDRSFIDYRDCAYFFYNEHGGDGCCVGESNILASDPYLEFYTMPYATRIVFYSEGKNREFFSRSTAPQRFHDLQKKIIACGYSTYDLA